MEPDWDAVRAEFPCAAGASAFLNTGTLGPVPRSVMDRYVERLVAWNEAGPGAAAAYGAAHAAAEPARAALAAFVGAEPEDLAFVHNVTDALNIAVAGLDLRAGSRVVTSDQEHGALVAILTRLVERGVAVDVIPFDDGGPGFTERLKAALRQPADLVAVSHLSCESGALLDMAGVVAAAHAAGARVLLDGAQAAGQVPLALRASGVDLYALDGHKWLLAPVGSGALYLHPAVRPVVALTFTGASDHFRSRYPHGWSAEWAGDARRFEYGTRNWATWAAWGDVLAWWNRLGPEAAYAHQRALARDFAERVRDCRGVTVLTPDPPPAGIVTVSVQGYGGAELTAALAERGVIGRAVQSGPLQGTRFSFAVFNNAADVAWAADSVRAVATGAAV